MSSTPATSGHAASGHDHDHDHDHNHDESGYHATLGGYIKGFMLAVVLTAIPFALVMLKAPIPSRLLALIILLLAAVQMVVHIVYFLHVSSRTEEGWTLLSTIFTVGLLAIMLAGSSWVMYNMNANMMPAMDHTDMPAVPAKPATPEPRTP